MDIPVVIKIVTVDKNGKTLEIQKFETKDYTDFKKLR